LTAMDISVTLEGIPKLKKSTLMLSLCLLPEENATVNIVNNTQSMHIRH